MNEQLFAQLRSRYPEMTDEAFQQALQQAQDYLAMYPGSQPDDFGLNQIFYRAQEADLRSRGVQPHGGSSGLFGGLLSTQSGPGSWMAPGSDLAQGGVSLGRSVDEPLPEALDPGRIIGVDTGITPFDVALATAGGIGYAGAGTSAGGAAGGSSSLGGGLSSSAGGASGITPSAGGSAMFGSGTGSVAATGGLTVPEGAVLGSGAVGGTSAGGAALGAGAAAGGAAAAGSGSSGGAAGAGAAGIIGANSLGGALAGLGGAAYGQYLTNQNQGMLQNYLNQIREQSYPFQQNVGLAQAFIQDPAQRMEMLRGTPGYLESMDFAERAQQRRNSSTGHLNTGYGDTLTADVMGRNAANWDQQLFNQLAIGSGMNFNNVQSQATLGAGLLPYMANANMNQGMNWGNAITNAANSPIGQGIGDWIGSTGPSNQQYTNQVYF